MYFSHESNQRRDEFLEVFGLCLTLFCNMKLKAITINMKKIGFGCKQVYVSVCISISLSLCACVHILWQPKLISFKNICTC